MTDQLLAGAPAPLPPEGTAPDGRGRARRWRRSGTGPRATAARRTSWLGFVLALPPVAFVALFAGLPIVVAALFTLGYGGGLNEITALIGQDVYLADGPPGTVEAYRAVFGNSRFVDDLVTTIVVTVVATAVVIAVAVGISLMLRLRGGRLAQAMTVLTVVPMFIPVVISAYALRTFYSDIGFLPTLFAQVGADGPAWSYSVTGVVIGSVWTNLPFAVLLISSGVAAVPDSVIDAARDCGAGLARAAASVILPMAKIPIIIATTFTAIGIIGSFTIPYFMARNSQTMLGVDIVNYFVAYNRPQQAIVMAFVVFALASLIAAAYVWANFRQAAEADQL